MKSIFLLLCLAHLWGCHSAPHGPLGYREPNCDDPETEQAALAAVDHINRFLLQGYKQILNQIDKVKVWSRRPVGEVYELEIDTLETTCHALDPTPLANCSVRQVAQHAVEGDCKVHVLKLDGKFSVMFAKCDSTPDSAEDVRKVCPICPLLAQLNDTRVVHAAEAALAAFNAQNNGSYYQILEISRAQLVPLPVSTYVEFAVAATDCVAKEVTDPAKCNLLAEKPVVIQPQPDANVATPDAVVEQATPASLPAGQPEASLVVGPMVVSPPRGPPSHRVHYDLRYAFSGVASVESASGEAFHPEKPHKVTQPGVAGAAGPLVRPCPGRIRHFKI
ncbi:alpha-2-HS-glycoprotein isoform X7 [Callospermophilus lateralis]|uniref:alpha-2-HS-glycoprotein isoform X7 n=1 Tax=Callospermophilus lateralis TaxID=76772 RepID=UPI00405393A3